MKSPLEYLIYDPVVAYTERATAELNALFSSLALPQRKRLLVEKLEQAKLSRRVGAAARREIDAETIRGEVKDSIRMFSGLNPEHKEEYETRIDYSSWECLHETLIQVTDEIRSKENHDTFSRKFELGNTYMAKYNVLPTKWWGKLIQFALQRTVMT